jgi:hypothetical protein
VSRDANFGVFTDARAQTFCGSLYEHEGKLIGLIVILSWISVGRQIPKIQVLPGYLTCQDRSGTVGITTHE